MPSTDPSLHAVINQAIEARLVDVHTAIPATIVSYDSATKRATVQVSIKRKYKDGEIAALPPIPDVPVKMPGSATAGLSWPLVAGDKVMLTFSERSLEQWKVESEALVDPKDARKFSLSDAVAWPVQDQSSAENLELRFGAAVITLYANGKCTVSVGGQELFAVLEELCDAIDSITVDGSQFIAPAGTSAAPCSGTGNVTDPDVATAKGKLTAMKGP